MKVTIITAMYNGASTIEATILSVLRQTHSDILHIIVDNASTDGSTEIARKWADEYPWRIKVVSESDTGIYNALNKGISEAMPGIIGTLHANDRLASDSVIEQVVKTFHDTDCMYLYGDIHYCTPQGKMTRIYSSRDFTPELLKIGIAPPHPSFYARKELFEEVGLYKEDYLIAADFEMFVRVMLVHHIPGQYLPVDMVAMSTGGISQRLFHRLYTNNIEKLRGLRDNQVNVPAFSILKRYIYRLKRHA